MWKWNKTLLLLLLFFSLVDHGFAQNKTQLKTEKIQLQKDIKKYKGLLNEITINQKKSGLAWLITQKKIGAREELINSINNEIYHLNSELELQQNAIDSLHNLLDSYRKQYEKMLIYAYKNRNATNSIVFVFSAPDFNEAYKRIKYIKKIGEYRSYQASEIKDAQKQIENRIVIIKAKKERKKQFLGDKYHEKKILQVEKEENQEILQNLKKDEQSLKNKIAIKEKEAKKLDDEISKIIQRELEEARKKAAEALAKQKAKTNTPKSQPQFGLTPVTEKLSQNFEINKGKFPWPVASGIISGEFGIQSMAGTHLKINNNGINIATNKGSDATAIFAGNVVAIIVIPSGGKSAVLIQHGTFFTLYSNLSTVKVKKGQEVVLGQKLGLIKTDDEGKTEIHFELWKGNEKQNPAYWLKTK